MGAAMARRLSAAGHRLTIFNRTRSVAESVAAGIGDPRLRIADRPETAVAGAEVVLSVLADGDVTVQVLLAPPVLAALAPGAVVCDLATSGIDAARELTAGLAAVKRQCVDAPVSGSVATVDAGQLLVMVGGEASAVAAVTPVLGAFARRIVHLGPTGSGQAMKLTVNLVVHNLNAALSEALVLAERSGISPERAYDVIEESVVGAPFVRYKRSAYLDDQPPVAMSLDLVRKDLRLIMALAATLDSPLPATAGAAEAVAAACDEGWGGQDMAVLRRFLAQTHR
jgi:3-hydroxyisobutyrate dehydrogenase